MQLGHRKCCLDVSGNVFFVSSGCAIVSSPLHSTNGDYVGDSSVWVQWITSFARKTYRGWQEPNISEHLISLQTYKK